MTAPNDLRDLRRDVAAQATKRFLTTKQLRERWGGCSHMLIERRLKSDPRFPRPVQFGKRWRLWAEDEVEAYERSLVVRRGAA